MQTSPIHERIDKIRDALAWSLQNCNVLSVGERIMMNQERAMWLRQLKWKKLNPDHMITPGYRVSAIIEGKIQYITSEIQRTGWSRYEYENQIVSQWK